MASGLAKLLRTETCRSGWHASEVISWQVVLHGDWSVACSRNGSVWNDSIDNGVTRMSLTWKAFPGGVTVAPSSNASDEAASVVILLGRSSHQD